MAGVVEFVDLLIWARSLFLPPSQQLLQWLNL